MRPNLLSVPLLFVPLLWAGCTASSQSKIPIVSKAPAVSTQQVAVPSTPDQPSGTPALLSTHLSGEVGQGVKVVEVGETGWAKTSINAVVFRNSITTHGDMQYLAFYNGDENVVLAKRKVGEAKWQTRVTQFKGNVRDAHNAISLGVDGKGVLHMSWDMHGNALHYAHGIAPGSLELSAETPMTGKEEGTVTYPQFYNLASGDLLFAYREGSSGDGDLMLNRYDVQSGKWSIVQHPLVEGEGKRNAYINLMAVDAKGGLHLSWCWRETPDVASNHDICYAFSPDEGKTWQKSTGEKYTLPITAETAEIAFPVPQSSDFINQTSMTTDAHNHPIIASYWRDKGAAAPQFQLVWHDGKKWRHNPVGTRTLNFQLGGSGTKRIPISRPHVVAGANNEIYVVFRDAERGADVSAAISTDADHAKWKVVDLYRQPIQGMVGVGTWGTQAEFKDIRVMQGDKALFASDFSKGTSGWKTQGGQWKVTGDALQQTSDAENVRALVGNANWSNYTVSLKARKISGKEGFLIIFGSPGDDTKSWWNLGGWGNTRNGLELPGAGSQQVPGKIETGRWYDVRVEVQGAKVRCFLDGKLIQEGTRSSAWEPSYDAQIWKSRHQLHLFWQNVGQGDGESLENLSPQPVGVLEWTP